VILIELRFPDELDLREEGSPRADDFRVRIRVLPAAADSGASVFGGLESRDSRGAGSHWGVAGPIHRRLRSSGSSGCECRAIAGRGCSAAQRQSRAAPEDVTHRRAGGSEEPDTRVAHLAHRQSTTSGIAPRTNLSDRSRGTTLEAGGSGPLWRIGRSITSAGPLTTRSSSRAPVEMGRQLAKHRRRRGCMRQR
jgi:hypothetical protein